MFTVISAITPQTWPQVFEAARRFQEVERFPLVAFTTEERYLKDDFAVVPLEQIGGLDWCEHWVPPRHPQAQNFDILVAEAAEPGIADKKVALLIVIFDEKHPH